MKAWLITNEFLHATKYSEMNYWLLDAANKYGIEMKIKTNAEVLALLGEKPRLEPLDFILFWDKDVRLAKYLERVGYQVINSADSIALCDDKSMTHLTLQTNGIKMPKTVVAPMTFANIGYTNYEFLKQVESKLSYPIIVKECFGSFGMQVYKVESYEKLLEKVTMIGAVPMIFQEYIEQSSGRDLRLHVVGDEVVTAMERYSVNGDFRANISNGGKMRRYEPTEIEKKLAIQVTKLLGLDFSGVDLLFSEDENPYVCEVNSNAHFRNIFDCTGVNVAEKIMLYAKQKYRKED